MVDALEPIKATLRKALMEASDLDVPFQGFSFGIATDHSTIPGMKPIAFRIERRANSPFFMNYYVSAAPLPTDAHVDLLKQLERLV